MRKWTLGAAFFALGAVAAIALLPGSGSAQNSGPPRPERVGIVDLQYIFDHYEKKKSYDAELDEEGKAVKKKLEAVEKDLAELETLSKSIAKDLSKQEKVIQAIIDKKAEGLRIQEFARFRIGVRQLELTNTVSREIDAELKAFIAANGYTLVLRRYVYIELPPVGGREIPAIKRDIAFFAEPQHDLTKPVLDSLNKKYLAGRDKKGG